MLASLTAERGPRRWLWQYNGSGWLRRWIGCGAIHSSEWCGNYSHDFRIFLGLGNWFKWLYCFSMLWQMMPFFWLIFIIEFVKSACGRVCSGEFLGVLLLELSKSSTRDRIWQVTKQSCSQQKGLNIVSYMLVFRGVTDTWYHGYHHKAHIGSLNKSVNVKVSKCDRGM